MQFADDFAVARLVTLDDLLHLFQAGVQGLNAPDLIDSFQKAGGIEPLHTSLDEMQQMIKRDQTRYSKIIRELQLKLD